MSDVPKLTDAEAAVLRVRLPHPALLAKANARITMLGLDDERSSIVEAALAEFDARKRTEIREEAWAEMRANYRQACCADCCRTYGCENGFPDLCVPHDVWKQISPNGDESGLLCPSCMCKRAERLGLRNVRATFRSGPFYVDEDSDESVAAKRAEIEAPLRERIARLEAMLREREWDEPSHIMDGDLRVPVNRCSSCGRHEQEGHDTECAVGIELEAAMKEAAR